MIRNAEAADRARVVELLKDSHVGAGFEDGTGASGFAFPFHAEYAARLFDQHLQAMNACCLVHDVGGVAQGVLMALAYQHPFGPVYIARESVWWIDPHHRGRAAIAMLDAYEAWAAAKGCAFAGMAGMGDDPEVAKLYLRRGYRAAEKHFLKAI